jgi:hypothetical protein
MVPRRCTNDDAGLVGFLRTVFGAVAEIRSWDQPKCGWGFGRSAAHTKRRQPSFMFNCGRDLPARGITQAEPIARPAHTAYGGRRASP